MLFIRVIVPGLFLAFALGVVLRAVFISAEHAALNKRMKLYEDWLKTLPSMTPEERTVAHMHVLRILKEGPAGGYRGPWEHVRKT